MNITILAKTVPVAPYDTYNEHGSLPILLAAIRTCYSPNQPSDILEKEGSRYFAVSENGEVDATRLLKTIVASKHTSTLEHVSFTFAVNDITRYTLGQITRHRAGTAFSVQSGRYVNAKTDGRMGGANFHIPEDLAPEAKEIMASEFARQQGTYDMLVNELKVKPEDARGILGQANTTSLVFTMNLRAALHFYDKRRPKNGAQAEAAEMAEQIRALIEQSEPWTKGLFETVSAEVDFFHNN